jgi:hypothetical protein
VIAAGDRAHNDAGARLLHHDGDHRVLRVARALADAADRGLTTGLPIRADSHRADCGGGGAGCEHGGDIRSRNRRRPVCGGLGAGPAQPGSSPPPASKTSCCSILRPADVRTLHFIGMSLMFGV